MNDYVVTKDERIFAWYAESDLVLFNSTCFDENMVERVADLAA